MRVHSEQRFTVALRSSGGCQCNAAADFDTDRRWVGAMRVQPVVRSLSAASRLRFAAPDGPTRIRVLLATLLGCQARFRLHAVPL